MSTQVDYTSKMAGGEPPVVISPIKQSGEKIAEFSIDGQQGELYALGFDEFNDQRWLPNGAVTDVPLAGYQKFKHFIGTLHLKFDVTGASTYKVEVTLPGTAMVACQTGNVISSGTTHVCIPLVTYRYTQDYLRLTITFDTAVTPTDIKTEIWGYRFT